ncbi:MAG: ABC transporter permease [Eubacteriales bacterium]|nr:ABC transporter permease [Eubacteriales bacterium]
MSGTFVGISIPVFWLGMILIILFSQLLRWFSSSGMHTAGQTGFVDMLSHIVLPAVTLSFIPVSVIARITKASMLEVMGQDYMRTAMAKGCTARRQVRIHAIKNAFVPILSILGIEVGYVLGGALVVENVFSWPGLGSLLLNAVLTRDYGVVVCGTCVICIIYALINLVNDLLYGVFDPRIQYD